MSTTTTFCSVQEILLKSITNSRSKLRTGARKRTALMIASIGIVASRVRPHQSLALLVSRRAMATGTLQTIGTASSIRGCFVGRTGSRRTRTHFGWITLASARTAGLCRWSQLTTLATLIVGVVANSVVLEFACGGIATLIASTTGITTTITIFSRFNDAVATLLSCDCRHSLVATEAEGFNAVALEG